MSQTSLERPVESYAPFFQPGTVFVTCATIDREPILGQPATAHLLRTVLHQVKKTLPFRMLGFVLLPNHLHLLLRPQAGIAAGRVVAAMQHRYQQAYPQLMGIPGEMLLWERRYRMEPMPSVAEFAATLDTIHYDPVHHELVAHPEEWAESSYSAWVERGLYKLGWGWTTPERLQS